MLQIIKKTSLLGIALLTGISAYAEDLLIWQVPDSSNKAPIFYEEASSISKPVSFFKPYQTVIVLSQEKDWIKIGALDGSGKIAWVLKDEVKSVTTLAVDLKKDASMYQCQVYIKGSEGSVMVPELRSYLKHHISELSEKNSKNLKSWLFGKKNNTTKGISWTKELDQLEASFAKQYVALMKQLLRIVEEEELIEKTDDVSEKIKLTEESKKSDSKKSEVLPEEKKSATFEEDKSL